jgi:hypothetical protein
LRKFIYLHPALAVLLPFLPCLAVLILLCYYAVITPPFLLFAAAWLLFLLCMPVRRAFPALMAEASRLLQQECDVPAFLSLMAVLRKRKHLPAERRLLIEANYALGLDAGGQTKEALACLTASAGMRAAVPPYARYQLDMAYACVCAHDDEKKSELPAYLTTLEQGYASMPLPLPVRQMLRRNLDNLGDIAKYHRGEYDGLRERFVARIEAYRDHPAMRRSMLLACFWLGRVYEAIGQGREAAAMYRYVTENGKMLGIVAEAQAALGRLG